MPEMNDFSSLFVFVKMSGPIREEEEVKITLKLHFSVLVSACLVLPPAHSRIMNMSTSFTYGGQLDLHQCCQVGPPKSPEILEKV